MNYLNLGMACTALALASGPAQGEAVIIEGTAVATRMVAITAADLSHDQMSPDLQRKLGDAARAVCREQYGDDTVYLVTSACFTGTYADGMAEYRRLRARFAVANGDAIGSAAIALTAR